MPAAKLDDPKELYVPSNFSVEAVRGILSALSAEDGQRFAEQIYVAVEQAQQQRDLRPINLVVESWWRTMMFETRPRFHDLWDAEATEPPLSLEDVRRRRAQRQR
ncbi:MAG: DUF6247 family protein [Actinomycetota bacterium]|nr:DUF6247 family protein [Actinomycetota bacterium]